MKTMRSITQTQMFPLPMSILLLLLLLVSLIMPSTQAVVYKRSLADSTTATLTENALTTIEQNAFDEDVLSTTITTFNEPANTAFAAKTSTDDQLISSNVTESVVPFVTKSFETLIQHEAHSPQLNEAGPQALEENNDIPIEDNRTEELLKNSRLEPNFELSSSGLTENLEQSIRKDVKNEIEMNQNAGGTATIIETLKLNEELRPYSQLKTEEEQQITNEPVEVTDEDENHSQVVDTNEVPKSEDSNTNIEIETEIKTQDENDKKIALSQIDNENDSNALETTTIPKAEDSDISPTVKQDQNEDSTEQPNVQETENFSVVLTEEALGVTELPLVLTQVPILDSRATFEEFLQEVETATTTVTHVISTHSVIKKQGVDIPDETELATTVEPLAETTEQAIEVAETKIENELVNNNNIDTVQENVEEKATNVDRKKIIDDDSSEEDSSVEKKIEEESKIIAKQSKESSEESDDSSEENQQNLVRTSTSSAIIETSSIYPNSGLEDIAEALPENENTFGSSKGSRSITSMHGYSDSAAPPNNALNHILNAEGQAQPTIIGSSSSAFLIGFLTGIAMLFMIIVLTVFLYTFRRHHGTLDIELQEQRCGKDNLDEEDTDTHTKLLEIELPPPTVVTCLTNAEETEECL